MTKRLVVQLARFGDIVQSKRLILSLRREGDVHLCVDRSLAALARLVYPDCVIHALPAHGCDARTAEIRKIEGRAVMRGRCWKRDAPSSSICVPNILPKSMR